MVLDMGNIRPSFIKSRALLLVQTYPDQFNSDFDNNKILVAQYSDVSNKRMRNWIAGYITRYVQRRRD
jgi:small subunit ribosomal protein S17e